MGKRQQSPFVVTASVTRKTLFCHRRGSFHLDVFFYFIYECHMTALVSAMQLCLIM